MSTVMIEIEGVQRVRATDDLPLSIGGASCHVALPDFDDDGPIAYLGLDRGEPFIQPAEMPAASASVTCNGVPLTASRWLRDRDEIGIGRHRLLFEITGDISRLSLVKTSSASGPVHSREAPLPSPPTAARRIITPTEFRPRWQSPPRRAALTLRPRAIVSATLIALLAAGAWFVLTARAIRIETVPPAESVEVRGGLLTPEIGGRFLLRPGSYTVTARMAGYRSLSESLEIGADTPSEIVFTLEPLGGLMSITSQPVDGAEITIGGEDFGVTPADGIELTAGEHAVEITAPLHLPFRTTIRVKPGDPPRQLVAELTPNWAPITIASSPAGATVSVDGTTVGTTPLEHKVEAGDRVFVLRSSGYKPSTRNLRIVAGEAIDLPTVELVPQDGHLSVVSEPSGATVTVNGVFRGTAPLEIDLPPGGAHGVEVTKAGHAAFSTEVRISSGQRSEIRAELELLSGEVSFSSLPPRADLLIDGVPAGTADQTLELDARPHEIEIRLEGYVPFRTALTPEPGQTQAVHAVLKETGPAGLPATIEGSQGMELVLVGPGRFTMGAARREPGRRANEVLHEVEITRPFYLSVREVTNREFREFRPEHSSGSVGNFNLEIDHHPVVNVTWNDAARFCNWLSEREGLPPVYIERSGAMVARTPFPRGYRLPTEAEWAWAARYPDAAVARKYAWGDSLPIPKDAGNYGDAAGAPVLGSAIPGYNDTHAATAPAGSFAANPLGLHNLGGNVSEWVNDLYTVTPSPPNEIARDPTGPSQGAYHVIRGSSWMDTNLTELRLSYRDYGDRARSDLGFRIARSAE